VVLIRQAIGTAQAFTTGSPTVTTTATHIIYQFNDSGTIQWVGA
jgi:hypothetical protein